MTKVLNAVVRPGDTIAYSSRRYWGMYTRLGVVIRARREALLVRVVKSSDGHKVTRLVWVTELDRVVKVEGSMS